MKNFLSRAILLIMFANVLSAPTFAQKTNPRFGTATSQDATFRGQKLQLFTVADTAGSTTDTIKILPDALASYVALTVKDSVALATNTKGCYLGDIMTIILYNTSGANHCVYFTSQGGASTTWRPSSTGNKVTLATSKNATIRWVWDGTAWSELSRSVQ